MKDDNRKLFCVFMGPLTDMAITLLMQPEIIRKNITVVWIGGRQWPDGSREYNLSNDVLTANIIFQSGVDFWQIPIDIYSKLRESFSELQVKPFGKIGHYLFKQILEVNDMYADNSDWPVGESWVLGDSAGIGVIMDEQNFSYTEQYVPLFNEEMNYIHKNKEKKLRVYKDIDSHFILEDFFSKLILFNS
jgi:inosine-uridine nucleoside N-ribohydrolase